MTFREQDLPWAHYSMLVISRDFKSSAHPVPALVYAFARAAGGHSFPVILSVVTAVPLVAKKLAAGRCRRRIDAIGAVKAGKSVGVNRLAAIANA